MTRRDRGAKAGILEQHKASSPKQRRVEPDPTRDCAKYNAKTVGTGQNSRLGAGLGAAGLASGFAASHFGRICGLGRTGVGSGLGEMNAVARRRVVSVGVEKMDEGTRLGRAGSL